MGVRAVELSSEDDTDAHAEADSDFEQEARRVLQDELADKVKRKGKGQGRKTKAEPKPSKARKRDAAARDDEGSDGPDEADVLKQYRRRQKKSGRSYEQMSRRQVQSD